MKGIERVKKARSQLILDRRYVFYGCLALDLKLIATTEVDTMAVDGVHLFVNEAFADTLSDAELRGVLIHEVCHVAYGHMFRRGKRDALKWNIAADYAINRDVTASGEVLPACAIKPEPVFDGMSAEAIYALLPNNGGGKGGSADPGGCGGVKDYPTGGVPKPGDGQGKSQAISESEAEAKLKAKVLQAAATAVRQAGSVPVGIKRLVEEIRQPPKQDWRALLEQFVAQSITREPTWNQPNRRYVANGLYLPGSKPNAANKIIVAIDTSGSIGRVALSAFQNECQAILDSGVVDTLRVVYCDAELHDANEEFERGDKVSFKPRGGGGTSFKPVMTWAAGEDAQALIYFMDLYVNEWGAEPPMPVLWAAYSFNKKAKPPFGDRIDVDPHA